VDQLQQERSGRHAHRGLAFLTENLLIAAIRYPSEPSKVPQASRRSARTSVIGARAVAFSNERGPLDTITLTTGLEVRAGQVPFRTEQGLDVLPIEAQIYYSVS